jgi:general secretion pathway protein D
LPSLLGCTLLVLLFCTLSACKDLDPQATYEQRLLQGEPIDDPSLAHWRGNGPTPLGEAPDSGLQGPPRRWSPLSQPRVVRIPASERPPPPQEPGSTAVDTGEGVTLNFAGADIHEVVATVLGQMLGQNYLLDPKIQGAITFHTTAPVPRAALPGLLEDMLALSGFAMVWRDGRYDILPLDQAAKAPAILSQSGGPVAMEPGFGVHVIPVRYISMEAAHSVVDPLLPPGRMLLGDPQRHLLLYVGTASEAQDVEGLLATIDVDPLAGKSLALFPIRYSDPELVARDLRNVLGVSGTARNSPVQIQPISRMNAILLIADRDTYVRRAREWIEQLDHGDESTERRLYVRNVQNGRATELASVLQQALGISGATSSQASPIAPGLTPRTTAVTGAAGSQLGNAAGPQPPGLTEGGPSTPSPAGAPGDAAGGGPGYPGQGNGQAPPGAMPPDQQLPSDAETGLAGGAAPGDASQANQLRIVADNRNNALVIYATPKEYELIDSALKRLDVVPTQVLIEATIAEVALNDNLKYGLQWYFNVGNSSFTFSTLKTGTVAQVFPGFNYLLHGSDARVVLDALSQITKVRVVSSPELMVLDNGVARLQVGDQVPIATQSSVSTITDNAPVVNQIEYRDTGVILTLSPRVSANGLVMLDVSQEVSDVSKTSSSSIDSPTIATRKIASSIAVNSGETIALGGLIKDDVEKDTSGIPILQDIPYVGHAFKTTDNTYTRTELIVLLSPRVIRSVTEARTATAELRQRLRGLSSFSRASP